jgi:hypothetical protein
MGTGVARECTVARCRRPARNCPTRSQAPRPDPGRYNWTVRTDKGENLGGFAVSRIACDPDQM